MSFYLKTVNSQDEAQYTLVCATVLRSTITNIDNMLVSTENNASLLGYAITQDADKINDREVYTIDILMSELVKRNNLSASDYNELISFNKNYILSIALLSLQADIYETQDFEISHALDTALTIYNRREYILRFLQQASDYEQNKLVKYVEPQVDQPNIYDYYRTISDPKPLFIIKDGTWVEASLKADGGANITNNALINYSLANQTFSISDIFGNDTDKYYISSLAFTATRYAALLYKYLQNVKLTTLHMVDRHIMYSNETQYPDNISRYEAIDLSNANGGFIKHSTSAIPAKNGMLDQTSNRRDFVPNILPKRIYYGRGYKSDGSLILDDDMRYISNINCWSKGRTIGSVVTRTIIKIVTVTVSVLTAVLQPILGILGAIFGYKTIMKRTQKTEAQEKTEVINEIVDEDSESKLGEIRDTISSNLSNNIYLIKYGSASTMQKPAQEDVADKKILSVMTTYYGSLVNSNKDTLISEVKFNDGRNVVKDYIYQLEKNYSEHTEKFNGIELQISPDVIIKGKTNNFITTKDILAYSENEDLFSNSVLVAGIYHPSTSNISYRDTFTSISFDILAGYRYFEKSQSSDEITGMRGLYAHFLTLAGNVHRFFKNSNHSKSYLDNRYAEETGTKSDRIAAVNDTYVNVDYKELNPNVRKILVYNMLTQAMYRDSVTIDTIVNNSWKQISDVLYKHNSATKNYSGVAVDISSIPDYLYSVKSIDNSDGDTVKLVEILSKLALPKNDSVEYMYYSGAISKVSNGNEYKAKLQKIAERYINDNDEFSKYILKWYKSFYKNYIGIGENTYLSSIQNINETSTVDKIPYLTSGSINKDFRVNKTDGVDSSPYNYITSIMDVFYIEDGEYKEYTNYTDSPMTYLHRPSSKIYRYPRRRWAKLTSEISKTSTDPEHTQVDNCIKLAYYERLFNLPEVKYESNSNPTILTNTATCRWLAKYDLHILKLFGDSIRRTVTGSHSGDFTVTYADYIYGFQAFLPDNFYVKLNTYGGRFSRNIFSNVYANNVRDCKLHCIWNLKLVNKIDRDIKKYMTGYSDCYVLARATSFKPNIFIFTPGRSISDESKVEIPISIGKNIDLLTSNYLQDGTKPVVSGGENQLHPYIIRQNELGFINNKINSKDLINKINKCEIYDIYQGFMSMDSSVQADCKAYLYGNSDNSDDYKIYKLSKDTSTTQTTFTKNTFSTPYVSIINEDIVNQYTDYISKSKIILGMMFNNDSSLRIKCANYLKNFYKKYRELKQNTQNIYDYSDSKDYILAKIPGFQLDQAFVDISSDMNLFFQWYESESIAIFNDLTNDADDDAAKKAKEAATKTIKDLVDEYLGILDTLYQNNVDAVKDILDDKTDITDFQKFRAVATASALSRLITYLQIGFISIYIPELLDPSYTTSQSLKVSVINAHDNYLSRTKIESKIKEISDNIVHDFYETLYENTAGLFSNNKPYVSNITALIKSNNFQALLALLGWKGYGD